MFDKQFSVIYFVVVKKKMKCFLYTISLSLLKALSHDLRSSMAKFYMMFDDANIFTFFFLPCFFFLSIDYFYIV